MAALVLIWRYRFRQAVNYIKSRFDRLTYVEFVLATLFVLFYFYRSVTDLVVQLQDKQNPVAAWQTYQELNVIIWVAVVIAALFHGRKKFSPVHLSLLLTQPISTRIVVTAIVIETALPLLFLLPFWLLWHLLFLVRFAAPWQIIGAVLWSLAYVGALWLNALSLSLAWFISRAHHAGYLLKSVLLLATAIYIPVYFFPLQHNQEVIAALLMAAAALVGSWWLLHRQLFTAVREYPQELFRESSARPQRHLFERSLRFYLLPAPPQWRPLIKKDMLYSRRYRQSFLLTLFAAAAAVLYSTWAGDSAGVIMEWHLAIVIGGLYILSNIAFILNDQEAENWALLKTVPLDKSRLWWSKFYALFLPYLWLEIISLAVLLRFPGQAALLWLRNLVFSLFLVTSLLFTQTNFSLYSYPYSKWAQIWYNLYVLTALAFFTVLLFPPLAIIFLAYGYFAIFRVQRRFDDWEATT